MQIKPVLSCPKCGKRVRTTQGLAGHVRFQHPELVPGYERPEFAKLAKALPAQDILKGLDKVYSLYGLEADSAEAKTFFGVKPDIPSGRYGVKLNEDKVTVIEVLSGCPSCHRPTLEQIVVTSGDVLFCMLMYYVTPEFIELWRKAQDTNNCRGKIVCLDNLED